MYSFSISEFTIFFRIGKIDFKIRESVNISQTKIHHNHMQASNLSFVRQSRTNDSIHPQPLQQKTVVEIRALFLTPFQKVAKKRG